MNYHCDECKKKYDIGGWYSLRDSKDGKRYILLCAGCMQVLNKENPLLGLEKTAEIMEELYRKKFKPKGNVEFTFTYLQSLEPEEIIGRR